MLNVTIFLSVTIFCIFLPVKQRWACFFLVFSTFVVLSILKDNFQVPLLAKCSVFPVIRPANRLPRNRVKENSLEKVKHMRTPIGL